MNGSTPRIALVHDWLTSNGGAERVLEALHNIYPEAPIYTTIYSPKKFPQFKNSKIITSYLNKFPLAHKKYQVFIPLMPKAIESFDLSQYDIIISDSSAVAKGVIKGKNAYHICYCHTPMRYVWLPEIDDRASSSWIRRQASKYLKNWDLKTIDRVDKYLANSENVKDRIKKIYNREAEVVYPPIETNRWQILDQIGDYFLYVNRLVSHKKPEIVVEAFNKLGKPLKIVGTGPEFNRLQKLARSNVEFLGRVSDVELKKLYSQCQALIYPSIDDFGMIAVEVMASGRPVISINEGGAAETVIEGKTGIHFDKQTPESIIEAVQKFNPSDYDPQEIRNFALSFDTQIFVEKIKNAVLAVQQET